VKPRVFIVNEPLKKDDATGEYVRFLPVDSASNFGDVIELTPKGNPGSPAVWMKMIRDGLSEHWEDGDYIVLMGDQAMLAYAASVVGGYIADERAEGVTPIPTLRFLKWERRQGAYTPLTLREPTESV